MSRTPHPIEQEGLRASLVRKRKRAGLTQDRLARRLGVYRSFVSKCETGGRRLDVIELLTVTKAMGLDPADLFREVRE